MAESSQRVIVNTVANKTKYADLSDEEIQALLK